MAEQKRFYWIKLKENFFDLETIDWLISQKNGCEYIVLYQKLCLIAANKDGRLAMQIGEMIIPYDAQKIARDTKFDIDTVIVAMELFRRIGLIFEESDGVLKIPYVNEIVGSEAGNPNAQRQKRFRERKKQRQLESVTNTVTKNNEEIEKREKRLDFRDLREKDVEEENGADATDYNNPDDILIIFKGNILLSENQMGHLLDLMGLEVFDEYIARLQAFIDETGANIKSHYQTLLKWYNEDRAIKYS